MTTFGTTSETSVEMRMYTRELYGRLEAETELSTGFERLGFIELAADKDRLEEYRRVAAFKRMCGNDVEEIGPDEIKKLFPLARVDDILAGFYLRQDGRVNPVDATMALAKGARQKGVKIVEGVSVTGVTTRKGPATGVATTLGDIGFARVLCNRITYVGELGYELCIPAEQAVHVYDRVVEAGKNFGLRHAGLRALSSLRMEKAYRDYGHDIDNTDDAYET